MSDNEHVMDTVQDRIMSILEVYPKISPTMLQAGLGPSLSPKIWRPALDVLIMQGLVDQRAEFPPSSSDRTRPYTIIEKVPSGDVSKIRVPAPPNADAECAA